MSLESSRTLPRELFALANRYLEHFREEFVRAQDPETRMYPEKREFFRMAKTVMEYLATPDNPTRPPEAVVDAARVMQRRVSEISFRHYPDDRKFRIYHFPVLEPGGTAAVHRAAKIWDVALSRALWIWDAEERAARAKEEAERSRISSLFFAASNGPRGKRVRRPPKGLG